MNQNHSAPMGEVSSSPISLSEQDHQDLALITLLGNRALHLKDCLDAFSQSLDLFEKFHTSGKNLSLASALVRTTSEKMTPFLNPHIENLLKEKINPAFGRYHAHSLSSNCQAKFSANTTIISGIRKWLADVMRIYSQLVDVDSSSKINPLSSISIPEPLAPIRAENRTNSEVSSPMNLSIERALKLSKAFDIPLDELSSEASSVPSSPGSKDSTSPASPLASNEEARGALFLSRLQAERIATRGLRRFRSLDLSSSKSIPPLTRSQSLGEATVEFFDVKLIDESDPDPSPREWRRISEPRPSKRPKLHPGLSDASDRDENFSRSPSPIQSEISMSASFQFPSQSEYSEASSADKRKKSTSKTSSFQLKENSHSRPKRQNRGNFQTPKAKDPMQKIIKNEKRTHRFNSKTPAVLAHQEMMSSFPIEVAHKLRQLHESLVVGNLDEGELHQFLTNFDSENRKILLYGWMTLLHNPNGLDLMGQREQLVQAIESAVNSEEDLDENIPLSALKRLDAYQVLSQAFPDSKIESFRR